MPFISSTTDKTDRKNVIASMCRGGSGGEGGGFNGHLGQGMSLYAISNWWLMWSRVESGTLCRTSNPGKGSYGIVCVWQLIVVAGSDWRRSWVGESEERVSKSSLMIRLRLWRPGYYEVVREKYCV